MKVKDFLKSVTLKCILVLLAIALVAGGLLSILNDVLYVTAEEKLQRVVSKLYGETDAEVRELELTETDKANSYGTVNTVYELEGNLIINSTGAGGYKGGTVTTWTVVYIVDGKVDHLKASVDSYEKQTLMSQLNAKYMNVYTSDISNGEYFSTASGEGLVQNVVTGATMSSNATNNAVSAALKFARIYTGEETVSNLVNADNVKNVKFSVDKAAKTVVYDFTAISVSTGMPNNYDLSVKVVDGKIESVTVITDGATSGYGSKVKNVSEYVGMDQAALEAFLSSSDIKTGATNSNKTIVQALLYATGNYEFFVNGGTLGDDTQDAINAFYGADAGVTYTEIEALDPDQAINVEKAFELSNGDMLALANGEYVFVTANEEPAAKNEVSADAAKAAVDFVRKYAGIDPTYIFGRYVDNVTYTWNADYSQLTYKLTAKSIAPGMPNDYSLQIIVKNGTISRVSVKEDGATYDYNEKMLAVKNYNGKTEEDLRAMLNGSEIVTGATNTNKTIVNALIFATANYDALNPNSLEYQAYVSDVVTSVEGTKVTYSLTAKSVSSGMPNNYGLSIIVDGGKIDSVKVVTDGATEGYGENMYAVRKYKGMSVDELIAFQSSSDIKTGATNSNNTIVNALLFATANYNYFLEGGNA